MEPALPTEMLMPIRHVARRQVWWEQNLPGNCDTLRRIYSGTNPPLHSCWILRGEDKFVPLHAIKAYRRTRGITPLILKLEVRWRWADNFRPWPPFTPEKNPTVPVDCDVNIYPFSVHVVIFNFYYQLMHLLIKTLSQFTFKTTHVKNVCAAYLN